MIKNPLLTAIRVLIVNCSLYPPLMLCFFSSMFPPLSSQLISANICGLKEKIPCNGITCYFWRCDLFCMWMVCWFISYISYYCVPLLEDITTLNQSVLVHSSYVFLIEDHYLFLFSASFTLASWVSWTIVATFYFLCERFPSWLFVEIILRLFTFMLLFEKKSFALHTVRRYFSDIFIIIYRRFMSYASFIITVLFRLIIVFDFRFFIDWFFFSTNRVSSIVSSLKCIFICAPSFLRLLLVAVLIWSHFKVFFTCGQ